MRVPLEWLKEFVGMRMRPEKLASALTMSGLEVESIERVGSESILDIAVTPNRGDCLSIIGVARDAAAVTGGKLKIPTRRTPRGSGKISGRVNVRVKNRSLCPRYCARILEGVRVGPSPAWMIRRLASCGIRTINNVVDSTNYVMLETGQPLHAFDMRFIRKGLIEVKAAGGRVPFALLDGEERTTEPEDLSSATTKGLSHSPA
ncbi:MAG TPA: phenylalanine--tRNA ligase beta subunit-related protein [bacterium]|nr:phenylalanine--tRNA ligase beta subunit-related protein [bacterium]